MLGVSACGSLFAQDHPLKWRSAGTGSSSAAVAAASDGKVTASAKLQPLSALPKNELTLNAPETDKISPDAPAPFVPPPVMQQATVPPAVRELAPPSKHLGGWNKMKIDADVKPASHPGEVDAFADPFQDRFAQYGAGKPAQSRYAPRTPAAAEDWNVPPQQTFPANVQQAQPPADPFGAPAGQPELVPQDPAPAQPEVQPQLQPQAQPRPRFNLPRDPDAENAVDPPGFTPRDPRLPRDPAAPRFPNESLQPGERILPGRGAEPDPSVIPPPLAEPGEKPPVGPAVEDDVRPRRNCDRVYNDRDCCEVDEQCLRARRFIRDSSIKNISLDITPRFKADSPSWKEDYASRDDRLKQADSRTWKDREGAVLATGRLIDLAQGKAVVREENGQVRRLSFNELSEDDICFVNAWWSLPTECIAGGTFHERNWVPSTFAWTASGLCHKPLYFEDVQLERYGHTAGPILQPFASGVHFFGNVFLLPYHAGINPPNECQYVLGYYRPGSCAPWVLPPFPLSVRGAAVQTGVIVGGVFLLP